MDKDGRLFSGYEYFFAHNDGDVTLDGIIAEMDGYVSRQGIHYTSEEIKEKVEEVENKIKSLTENAAIIRSLAKIKAAVNNAQIFLKIQKEWGSFDRYIWHFTNGKIVKNQDDNIPAKTALSDMVAADLQQRGMKFVGSVIIYSYLQAIGVVDDHERGCFRY